MISKGLASIINTVKSLDKRTLVYIKIGMFVILGFYILIPNDMIFQPESGIDPSWKISLGLAEKHNLIFGKDYIFTFGPLGFLTTKLIISHSYLKIALFEICFISLIVFLTIRLLYLNGLKIFDLILLLVYFRLFGHRELTNIFTFTYILSILLFLRTSNKYYLIISGFIAIFSFYTKVNYGLVLLFCTLLLSTLFFYNKKLIAKDFFYLNGFLLSSILILSFFLNISLWGYIESSLHLISAYNDSMIRHNIVIWELIFGLEIVAAFCVMILIYLSEKETKLDKIVCVFLSSMYMYLLFKNAYVRADHASTFFHVSPLPFITVYLFSQKNYHKWTVFCVLLFCVNIPLIKNTNGVFNFDKINTRLEYENGDLNRKDTTNLVKNAVSKNNLTNNIEHKSYFSQLLNRHDDLRFLALKNETINQLNNHILTKIGNNSVDIIPTEISVVYKYNLKYNPRPVVQSYAAYDEYLDSLNFKKLVSNTSPAYILFQNASIDGRYPFWDESISKRGLLTNYQYEDIDTNFNENESILLLKKRNDVLKIATVQQSHFTVKMDEWHKVESNQNLHYLYADVQYSVIGKTIRFLFRPPKLKVELAFENGDTKVFTAIVPILKTGVLINKRVLNTQDAKLFFTHKGSKNGNITGFRFFSDEIGFNPDISCTIIEHR